MGLTGLAVVVVVVVVATALASPVAGVALGDWASALGVAVMVTLIWMKFSVALVFVRSSISLRYFICWRTDGRK